MKITCALSSAAIVPENECHASSHTRIAARPHGVPIDPRTLRLGIPRSYFLSLLDPQVASAFDSACERLRDAGATLDEVSIPHAGDISAIYLHIVLTEAAAYHAKTLERRPEDYTPNVRVRLEMGRYVLGEDYARALRGRELIRREVDAALDPHDVGRRRGHWSFPKLRRRATSS